MKTPADGGKIKHVFYIVRENRTYDQILGDEPRGDGDPKLELFGEEITPNAHALARALPAARPRLRELGGVDRRPLLDVRGRGRRTTSSKNWHQNYGGRRRPYDFGIYSVTWPSQRFLFDQAEKQGISWFNFGEAIAGVVPLTDDDRNARGDRARSPRSSASPTSAHARVPAPVPRRRRRRRVLPQRRVLRRRRRGALGRGPGHRGLRLLAAAAGHGQTQRRRPTAESRFDCFKHKFEQQLAAGRGAAVHLHHVRERPHGRHHARAGARRTR